MDIFCLTCLCPSTNRTMLPLTHSFLLYDSERTSYLDCLRYCIDELIDDLAPLPSYICTECSTALQVAYQFIRNAKVAHQILLKRLEESDRGKKFVSSVRNEKENMPNPRNNKVIDVKLLKKEDQFIKSTLNVVKSLKDHTMTPKGSKDGDNNLVYHPSLLVDEDNSKAKNEELTTNSYKFMDPAHYSYPNPAETDHDYSLKIKDRFHNEESSFILHRNRAKVNEDNQELKAALESQDAKVDKKKNLLCSHCNMKFTDIKMFIRHRNHHKGITPFRCDDCNYFTCYPESLRKHCKRVHNSEVTNEILDQPIHPHKTPTERPYHEVTYECEECEFSAYNDRDIKNHISEDHSVDLEVDHLNACMTKVFNCPDCYRTFKKEKSMHIHFTLMHGASMGVKRISYDQYTCEHCAKSFQFKMSLVSHQRVCCSREAVNCNICNEKFSTVRKFEYHLRSDHAIVTIHECEVCGKNFGNPVSLSIHRKRHTERHFQCTLCPRNYVNNAELKVHFQRVHGTESQTICRTCGQTFTHVGYLRDHEHRVHCEQQRQQKCGHCNYQTTSHYRLRDHQYRMHYGGIPYKCGVCEREFVLRSELRRHSRNVHSIELTDQEMAMMFRKKFGYPNRFDAFSKANNSLEITEVNEADVELELQEYGLNFDDLMRDLFKE